MMSNESYILMLFGMGLVTYLPRWLSIFLLARRSLPEVVVSWLDLIPVSLLSAILIPELLTSGQPRLLNFASPELLVAVPTFIFAFKTKSLVGTVIFGMALFWIARMIWG